LFLAFCFIKVSSSTIKKIKIRVLQDRLLTRLLFKTWTSLNKIWWKSLIVIRHGRYAFMILRLKTKIRLIYAFVLQKIWDPMPIKAIFMAKILIFSLKLITFCLSQFKQQIVMKWLLSEIYIFAVTKISLASFIISNIDIKHMTPNFCKIKTCQSF
jgi:hypothetical protein